MDTSKIFVKVFNHEKSRNRYHYHEGVNDLKNTKEMDMDCKPQYAYFTDIEHIFAYLNYGSLFAFVTPIDEPIYEPEDVFSNNELIPGWKTQKFELSRFYSFNDKLAIKFLLTHADLSVGNYQIFDFAIKYYPVLYESLKIYMEEIDKLNSMMDNLELKGYF